MRSAPNHTDINAENFPFRLACGNLRALFKKFSEAAVLVRLAGILIVCVFMFVISEPVRADDDMQTLIQQADNGDTTAQYKLAVRYKKGQGVAQDYAQAAAWYRKAAEQGDADAQLRLGFMYKKGQGVEQDYAQAVAWYRKAAEQGNAFAQRNLGTMYYDALGVAQDYVQAVAWYRKAADQGAAVAQYNLGVMYESGQGVAQDYVQAVAWYRKAADQGDAGAQNNLGVMYELGQGVDENGVLAYVYFNIAAGFGDKKAVDNRERMLSKLTSEQIREGQTLSSAWKPQTALPERAKTCNIKPATAVQKPAPTANTSSNQSCEPPTGGTLRYSDRCMNGDCVRTFENGCKKRFQAPYCYDSLSGEWAWKPNGC